MLSSFIWCLAHWLQFESLLRRQACTTAAPAELSKHRYKLRPAKHVKLWRNLATANFSTSPILEMPAVPEMTLIASPLYLAPFHTLAWVLPQLKEKLWHGAPIVSIFVSDSPSLTEPAVALSALQTHPGSICRWFIVWTPGDSQGRSIVSHLQSINKSLCYRLILVMSRQEQWWWQNRALRYKQDWENFFAQCTPAARIDLDYNVDSQASGRLSLLGLKES